MLEDENWTLADEAAASLVSNSALMGALFTMLQERGVLSAEDVNALFDEAAITLEKSEASGGPFTRRARQILDRTARNLARGPVRR